MPPEAERRPLTVLFCDLVDSTRLASHLDPEDFRDVVRAYHQACAEVIERFDGYVAQYLGDGLLVYFGYPVAHEDDAQRAVWTGLGILEALAPRTAQRALPPGEPVAVRLGVHTGLVVMGEVGAGARHEPLALGETPNIAARLQALAAPNTLVISAATYQLIAGYFTCEALGEQPLRGLEQPLRVYRVLRPVGCRVAWKWRRRAADPPGGPGVGGGDPAGALGAGQSRHGPGGGAGGRGGHWEVTPGAGAERSHGQ